MRDDPNSEKKKELYSQLDSLLDKITEDMISSVVKKYGEKEYGNHPPDFILFEVIAFDLRNSHNNEKSKWGTYYGPLINSHPNMPEMNEYPSLESIKAETIAYWKKRVDETDNPLLRARYADLVWDLTELITGTRPHYSFAFKVIDSIMEIAQKDVHRYEMKVIEMLKRALTIALTINSKDVLEKIKKTIILYENKIAQDDKPGLWGFSYEILLKNKNVKLEDEEKLYIISNLEERFNRLLTTNNYFPSKIAALHLIEYYKKTDEREKKESIISRFSDMVHKYIPTVSPLVGINLLEELYFLYLQEGLKDNAAKVAIQIKELGIKSLSELKEFSSSIQISEDEMRQFVEALIAGDVKTAFIRVALHYIPNKDEVMEQLKKYAEETPLAFLFPIKLIGNDGQILPNIGSLEDDMEGHLVHQISQRMQISSVFLRETIAALLEKNDFSLDYAINYLYESPIFEEDRKQIIEQGMDAYLKADFIIALHILIPQIETLLRNLASKIGMTVLKPSRHGGFQYRTMDDLLRDINMTQALGKDLCFYLRVLLTDPRGWNLRNEVCHGLAPTEIFNRAAADWVIHAILCMALVKEKKSMKGPSNVGGHE